MPTDATTATPTAPTWWWMRDLEAVAAVGTAGMLVGAVVIGVGSRLAMRLLALLNPDTHGVTSDDGFVIGGFDLGATVGLVVFSTVLGVVGGFTYLGLRPLAVGPPWFRRTAMVAGPTTVAAALLVHTDGVDFRLLDPTWLAIGLFVTLPLAATVSLIALSERWLRDDSWFRSGPAWRLAPAAPALLLAGVAGVAAPVVLAGRWLYVVSPQVRAVVSSEWTRWSARAVLGMVFAVAAFDLTRDVVELLG